MKMNVKILCTLYVFYDNNELTTAIKPKTNNYVNVNISP